MESRGCHFLLDPDRTGSWKIYWIFQLHDQGLHTRNGKKSTEVSGLHLQFSLLTPPHAPAANVVHASVLGKHIIVINSREDAIEMLEKRAEIYSSRPYIPMLDL